MRYLMLAFLLPWLFPLGQPKKCPSAPPKSQIVYVCK